MPYRPSLSVQSILWSIRGAMHQCIDRGVNNSFSAAEKDTQGQAGEIERLVYFFTDGVSDIQAQLNGLLSPFSLRVTLNTIFCHQSPTVDALPPFVSGKGSELADLAILIRYGNGIERFRYGVGNAVLLQAKSDFSPGCSPEQEYLFERASAFLYRATTMRSRGRRSLKKANDCLWYWDFQTKLNRAQGVWHTQTHMKRRSVRSISFSELLFGLIAGNTGRGVRNGRHLSGWSAIIHDLLEVTATRVYRRKIVNCTKIVAGQRGRFCLAVMNAESKAGVDPPVFLYNGGSAGWDVFGDEFPSAIVRISGDADLPHAGNIVPESVEPIPRYGSDSPEGDLPSFLLISLDRRSED